MEEKKLNEKESLELITQMIQNSKKNLQLGDGNMFLLWGYLSTITALVVFASVKISGDPIWNIAWFAIPAIGWPVMYYQKKKEAKPVLTYTDKTLVSLWTIMGQYGIGIALLCCMYYDALPLLPSLIMILCSMSVALSAKIINDKFMEGCSGAGLAIGVVSLSQVFNPPAYDMQYVGFAIAMFIMMALPGHRLNKEAKRLCSKN